MIISSLIIMAYNVKMNPSDQDMKLLCNKKQVKNNGLLESKCSKLITHENLKDKIFLIVSKRNTINMINYYNLLC